MSGGEHDHVDTLRGHVVSCMSATTLAGGCRLQLWGSCSMAPTDPGLLNNPGTPLRHHPLAS